MGVSHSIIGAQPSSNAQLQTALAHRLEVAFDASELQVIQENLTEHAQLIENERVWTQTVFVQFLEVPQELGQLFYNSASYCANWTPANEHALDKACDVQSSKQNLLTRESLTRVIAIFTGKTDGILEPSARLQLIFNSFTDQAGPLADEHVLISRDEKSRDVEKAIEARTAERTIRKVTLLSLVAFLLSIQGKRDYESVSAYLERSAGSTSHALDKVTAAVVDTISENESITFVELERFMRKSPGLLFGIQSLYNRFCHLSVSPDQTVAQRTRLISDSNLLNDGTSAQLSLFLPKELIFGSLDKLYIASYDGFSMGSLETKVCRYPGATITLIHGKSKKGFEVLLGFFCVSPWKQSLRNTFGDSDTILFQLLPRHKSYTSNELRCGTFFSKSSGIGVGIRPPPAGSKVFISDDVSLYVDTSLEIANLRNNDGSTEVVDIREVEVWGLGGDKEAQRKAWAWEEAEAARRRTINIHDIQGDYSKCANELWNG